MYEELDVSEGLGSSDFALFLATQWEQELFKRHHLSLHFSQEGKVNTKQQSLSLFYRLVSSIKSKIWGFRGELSSFFN